MAKNILAKTKYDSSVDWQDVCDTFTQASGSRVWCERNGKYMNILTDGDPEAVMEILIERAAEIIVDDALIQALTWELSGMVKWERNARLN